MPSEGTSPRASLASMPLSLDAGGAEPLHRQLYRGLSELILDGRLAAGARLPSSRALARELSISRNTVLAAFDQLTAEGYLEGRHGSGSFVAADLPLRAEAAAGPPTDAAPSARGRDLAAAAHRRTAVLRPFAVGFPAVDAFPADEWARLSARVWRGDLGRLVGPGAPPGDAGLTAAIAGYLRTVRGVRCGPEQVIVLSGAQQAVGLAARVLLDRGARAILEEPGYPGIRAALAAAGIALVPAPVDAEGLDVAAAERLAPDARLVCVAPSHQYPLGITMSLTRRLQVIDWARRRDAWIVEDDWDSEFRYAGPPLAALQGLDEAGRTIYVGSFSKVLLPGLRIAYLVAPAALAGTFRDAAAVLYDQPSLPVQATLAAFFETGGFAHHVRRMRELYRARQAFMLAAADRELAGLLDVRPHRAGMHLLATPSPRLAAAAGDGAIAAAADAAGITLAPLDRFYIGRPDRRGLMMGYAAHPEAELAAATARLAAALRPLAAG